MKFHWFKQKYFSTPTVLSSFQILPNIFFNFFFKDLSKVVLGNVNQTWISNNYQRIN
jgi:hypothetical protein